MGVIYKHKMHRRLDEDFLSEEWVSRHLCERWLVLHAVYNVTSKRRVQSKGDIILLKPNGNRISQ